MGSSTHVARIALERFRCFAQLDVEIPAGRTLVIGDNGHGKTSLLEACAWPARARSFRGVPDAALLQRGAESAVLRCEVHEDERVQWFEAEIHAVGRNRMQVNRQAVQRRRDLVDFLRVTVFSPDDLELVKGGPSTRREYLDELLVVLSPRYAQAASDVERVLRQRNALLKEPRHLVDSGMLDVFDDQLCAAGGEVIRGRLRLIERLVPELTRAYGRLDRDARIDCEYRAEWCDRILTIADVDAVDELLREALRARRGAELDRRVTLVGPHRDDMQCRIDALDARTQASQGEQRSFALALRLAGHAVVTDIGHRAPVLMLDDVFSELDVQRAEALVAILPEGQALITSATELPDAVAVDHRLEVRRGHVERIR